VYPFLGRTAFVFVPPVRDLSSGDPLDFGRRLGNVAAHEAAHTVGRWGHEICGGFENTGQSACPPYVMQEGVAGEDRDVIWGPVSRAWLDKVLGGNQR